MNFFEFAEQHDRAQQVTKVDSVLMMMKHTGMHPDHMSVSELADYLEAEDRIPPGMDSTRFAAMVKSRARENFSTEKYIKANWNHEQMDDYT